MGLQSLQSSSEGNETWLKAAVRLKQWRLHEVTLLCVHRLVHRASYRPVGRVASLIERRCELVALIRVSLEGRHSRIGSSRWSMAVNIFDVGVLWRNVECLACHST